MARYDYDMIVIGGGAGGFVSSKVAAGFGKNVAMVEKKKLGGECTNAGCVPSKALLKAAAVAYQVRHLQEFGIEVAAPPELSATHAMAYARAAIKKVYDSHPASVFEKAGIDVLFGSPRFLDSHRIDLGGKVISARKFMLCTGSSALVPPLEGLDAVPFYTNENLFDINEIPPSLLVMGTGPVGIEMAQAFNRLGCDVTVLMKYGAILQREDRELVDLLQERLSSEGIRFVPNTRAVRIARGGSGILLTVERGGTRSDLTAAAVLVAVGRRPNTGGLALEKAGVQYGPRGIITDRYFRTTASNIYACGDVIGAHQFSHITEYQAVTAVRNAFLPVRKKMNYDTAIWCTFTDPELAHAGMTEEEARSAHGDAITVLRYSYGSTDRARTEGTEFGMSKIICDRRGMVLGAHILGKRAGEVIHEVQVLRHLRRPLTDIASMIHIYPTYTDVVRQPAKYYYIERLRNNPFVKFASRILGRNR